MNAKIIQCPIQKIGTNGSLPKSHHSPKHFIQSMNKRNIQNCRKRFQNQMTQFINNAYDDKPCCTYHKRTKCMRHCAADCPKDKGHTHKGNKNRQNVNNFFCHAVFESLFYSPHKQQKNNQDKNNLQFRSVPFRTLFQFNRIYRIFCDYYIFIRRRCWN